MPDNEQIIDYIISDFRDGMMTAIDSPDKPATAFEEIKNARLDIEDGSLVKRLQSTYYNEESLGAYPVKSGVRFYYGDKKELIISYGDALLKGNDGLGTFPDELIDGLTTNTRWSFLTYKDKLYCFNGKDDNLRYDGTDIKVMGCQRPATTFTAAEGDAGDIPAGTYKYLVTYLYDGYQESNPNATPASVIIANNKKINLSNIPTAAAGQSVTARKIYRTLKDGELYYYVDTIPNNTTTTYVDNTLDAALTVAINTNHDIPPKFKMAVLHKDRIFGLVPDSCEIDFTSIEGYSSLPDIYDLLNNYLKINEDDGEKVIGITEIPSGIICFKRSRTFLLRTTGNDPLQWSVELLDNHGIVAPYSIAKISPTQVIALSMDKENQLDSRIFSESGSLPLGKRIKDILDNVNYNFYDEVVGAYYGSRYYMAFTDNIAGLEYNHRLMVLQFNQDFSRFGYTMDDAKIACFIPCYGAGDFGQMYVGRSSEGRVLRLETTTLDLVHRTKSDINTGTLVRLTETGTEEYPEYRLTPTAFDDLFSNTLIDDMVQTIDSYDDPENDIIDHQGYIKSDILYIGAKVLSTAYWTATLGVNGGTALRLRTGNTIGECNTATWSEWFTEPNGSDISSVQGRDYIQYELAITSDDLPDPNTYLYRDDFIIKISAGFGSPFEDYINFLIDTGKIHFGYPDQIKRLRQVVLEYETEGTVLQVYLAKNESDFGSAIVSVNTNTYPNIRQVIVPFNKVAEYFRLKITEQSLLPVKIKSIRLRFSVLPKQSQILLRGRG